MADNKTNQPTKTLAKEIVETISKDEQHKEVETKKFVVVRDNRRVSDSDYENQDDQRAIDEKIFWKRVVDNWSPGEKVEIVPFNKKLHRVW